MNASCFFGLLIFLCFHSFPLFLGLRATMKSEIREFDSNFQKGERIFDDMYMYNLISKGGSHQKVSAVAPYFFFPT